MKPITLLVAVKQTVDYRVKVHVNPDGLGLALAGLRMEMNPFDAIALEAAIRFKEAGIAKTVIAVTIGQASHDSVLRTAIAMGADRVIRIDTNISSPTTTLEPFSVAKLLQALVNQLSPDLVLTGKQAIDDDCNQTGQMLAALLDWPQATFASDIRFYSPSTYTNNHALEWKTDHLIAQVAREVDNGLETIAVQLPAVITADLRLNQPRYINLPQIMRAKQHPIEIMLLSDLGVTIDPQLTVLAYTPRPAPSRKAIEVDSVPKLIKILTTEEGLLR